MSKTSAGLIVYRWYKSELQVLLVHPGGPFWKNKDEGAWNIPKGEYVEGEVPLEVAKREFYEETGIQVQGNEFIELGTVKLKSGKLIIAFAAEASFDEPFLQSNTFEMEWPPKSGKMQVFPEVDRAAWFSMADAAKKLNAAQVALLGEVESKIAV